MADDIVAVDVGGTFTDICVLRRDTGQLRVAKVPSTANPIDGVMSGVETAGIDLSQVAPALTEAGEVECDRGVATIGQRGRIVIGHLLFDGPPGSRDHDRGLPLGRILDSSMDPAMDGDAAADEHDRSRHDIRSRHASTFARQTGPSEGRILRSSTLQAARRSDGAKPV